LIAHGVLKSIEPDEDDVRDCGKYFWQSPEVVQNRPYSFASDVWSLGTIIFQTMTIKIPFQSLNINQLFNLIPHQESSSLSSYFSLELRKVVTRMIIKDPSSRLALSSVLSIYRLFLSSQNQ
jgi:NIMA (never in mitosis gene a)-related kinase